MNGRARREMADRQAVQERIRLVAFVLISLFVLVATAHLFISAFSPKTPPPEANVIDITAYMGGFSQQEVRIPGLVQRCLRAAARRHLDRSFGPSHAQSPGALEPASQGMDAPDAGRRRGGHGIADIGHRLAGAPARPGSSNTEEWKYVSQ